MTRDQQLKASGQYSGDIERFLPVAAPALVGNEKTYVMDCLESTWISSNGSYINRFEEAFAAFCGTKHAIAVCNGTVALHVALLGMDIGPGDEVIVPTLTFVATANAVAYCGAKPVFVDCEPDTWNMDVGRIEERITPQTRGIIVVHLFGHPVDMDAVWEIANRHNLFVVEDAAEAHGAEYKGRRAGQLGQVATFSFYGNKIITTGEGGMIVTDDDALASKMRQIKGQGQDPKRRYWFPMLGYNYRMTNIQAAIGLGQLERIDWHLARRREVAGWYLEDLGHRSELRLQAEQPWARNAYWINSVVISEHARLSRDQIMVAMEQRRIETRPFFYPMHTLPMYRDLAAGQQLPVAESCAARGMNLPSSADLTREDVSRVSRTLLELVGGNR
jgi:perosamine synthetase